MVWRAWRCLVLACVVALGSVACDALDDAGPEAALLRFMEAMERSARDPAALREAYELLAEDARRELASRAEQAATLSGRHFEPWEMLAQGRYRRRITPSRSTAMRARIDGDAATVLVQGEGPEQQASVALRRENGAWRVVLQLPRRDGRDPDTRN